MKPLALSLPSMTLALPQREAISTPQTIVNIHDHPKLEALLAGLAVGLGDQLVVRQATRPKEPFTQEWLAQLTKRFGFQFIQARTHAPGVAEYHFRFAPER